MQLIVTIDGPAGAGKSTAAKRLAERLGFEFLDTGAMYRAVTLAALRANISCEDSARLDQMLEKLSIRVEHGKTFLNEEDISGEIRTSRINQEVIHFADKAVVRRHLTRFQRDYAHERNVITEGRDQGTVVFPDAERKFYLEADSAERARRRHDQLVRKSPELTVAQVESDQATRDTHDSSREHAPLTPAPDAIRIDSTLLSIEQTVDLLASYVAGGPENIIDS